MDESIPNPEYSLASIEVEFRGLQPYQVAVMNVLNSETKIRIPIQGRIRYGVVLDEWFPPKSSPVRSMQDSADTNPESALKAILAKAQRHL